MLGVVAATTTVEANLRSLLLPPEPRRALQARRSTVRTTPHNLPLTSRTDMALSFLDRPSLLL